MFFFSLTACASVKLTHGGEKARVLSAGEVANCQKRGATTVKVKPTLLTVPRQPTIIAKELQILARNSSVNMGGDTVTAFLKLITANKLLRYIAVFLKRKFHSTYLS